jgi:hypothetical protein
MVGSAGGWRRGVAKEAKNGSRGEVSSGLGEGAERVIVFRVICGLGFLCDSPELCNIAPPPFVCVVETYL